LIDNYINSDVIRLFCDKNENVKVIIYTKNVSLRLKIEMDKFNEQYRGLEIKEFDKSHDRFNS
jgi:hypothetical protein